MVLLDEERPAAWMQSVAMEMNQAETAFLLRQEDGFGLRWFTPVAEVDLCGHATLASAHVLWAGHHLKPKAVARFHTRSGLLTARRDDAGRIEIDLPAIASRPSALGLDPAPALGAAVRSVAVGDFDLLCELEDGAAVRALAPDLLTIAGWPVRGVLVTAPGDRDGIDYVARCFFPALGIPEDPVTGSAHCALAPYWGARLGRQRLVGEQASRRGGVLDCTVAGDRVRLAGHAVVTLEGTLLG